MRHRLVVCDSIWWQIYPPLACAKLCQIRLNIEDEMTILFELFVLPGETVGYDIEATLNMTGSYEYVSRIAAGQDAPNQETHVP